ncbi:MAG: hypothetical protein Q8Q42_03210 [Nanoarchaeota archaeon]|nr:hypothetical protein [Nanoarchaeota archaeon]
MRKKGVIFALDGAIAVTIVLIMLINTTYYFATTSKESVSQTQVIKRGYDVLAMFDELGQLDRGLRDLPPGADSISETFIDEYDGTLLNVSNFLPSGYNMMLILDDANKTECIGDCILINGGSVDIETLDLAEAGNFVIQVNAVITSAPAIDSDSGLSVIFEEVTYPLVQRSEKCVMDVDCTYSTLDLVALIAGENTITISSDIQDNIEINWIKVLDNSAYSLSTEREIPDNRFVGTGERWYAGFDNSFGHFEGFHRARFKIWIV